MEICSNISKLFYTLKELINPSVTFKTHTKRVLPVIDKNSSIGMQIKYYRMLQDVYQEDLALKLGYTREAIFHIENREMKLVNVNLIKDVIKELNIEDKIIINDEYIKFLLNNPSKTIINFRKEKKLKRIDLSKMIDTDISVIKRWENGTCNMTRASFEKIKKCMT